MAVALNVARRYTGPCNDQLSFTFICSAFIAMMGSDAEKKWVREELPAELERRKTLNPQLPGSPSKSRDSDRAQRPDHSTAPVARPDVDIALDAAQRPEGPSVSSNPSAAQAVAQ